jgi:L-seryl-tRNA(Ser) seleniumtransferase
MSRPVESVVHRSGATQIRLPSVDRFLKHDAVAALLESHGHRFVVDAVRAVFAQLRAEPAGDVASDVGDDALVAAVRAHVAGRLAPRLRRMINLTGTVLHTNMGRALLADQAIQHIAHTMGAPNNLEYDVESGERGDRDTLVEALLCELTGAEAATVVNNNAAAVLLTIAALAAGREVLVSRGELVEIGGAFRMPDVMASAGARMVEVGTTNRTHVRDYQNAINANTALLMKVHTSNYAIEGFTAAVSEAELARIAHGAGLPLASDLGSGSLVDLSRWGLPKEPLPQDMLEAGVDVVTFSGDKLLGGPQAGLIVGRRELIARIKKHPLKRALRVSKLVVAALEATLALYRHPESLADRLPTLRLLARDPQAMLDMARRIEPALRHALGRRHVVEIVALKSQIGSGSLPVDRLPSAGFSIRPSGDGRRSGSALNALADALRALPIPVVGRIAEGALLLDLRCLEDEAEFVAQLEQLTVGGGA